MNIAIFASAFYPHVGGVEELCRQLAHEYRRRGCGIVVFTERWPRSLPEYEEYEGIPVHRFPFRVPTEGFKSKLGYWLTSQQIRRRLFTLVKRYKTDVLHVQCVSSNAFYALATQRAQMLPLVLTLQGELTMDAERIYERSRFARDNLRCCLQRADAITACSRQTLQETEAFFGQPFGSRGQVVYNGIAAADLNGVKPFEHARPYVFALGRHVAQKGFDVLLRALKLLAARNSFCDLILAGDGVEQAALRSLAAELGLTERVLFTGRVNHGKVMSLFAGCRIFVLPSRHEPFGIVNLEAMAAGKPIVASWVGGVPEIVVEGENGLLVPPEEPEALATAIGRLLSDEALRQRLGANARERAKCFTWSKIAAEYMEVYEVARRNSQRAWKGERQKKVLV